MNISYYTADGLDLVLRSRHQAWVQERRVVSHQDTLAAATWGRICEYLTRFIMLEVAGSFTEKVKYVPYSLPTDGSKPSWLGSSTTLDCTKGLGKVLKALEDEYSPQIPSFEGLIDARSILTKTALEMAGDNNAKLPASGRVLLATSTTKWPFVEAKREEEKRYKTAKGFSKLAAKAGLAKDLEWAIQASLQKSDTEVAKELGVTEQAVRRVRKLGFERLGQEVAYSASRG